MIPFAAQTARAMELPRKAPALAINRQGGGQLQLASFTGKPVLLAFILTTCPHCQFTTGLLKQYQQEYGPRGLQIVEAAIDESAAALLPGFVMRFTPNFAIGFVSYDTAAQFLQHNPMLIMHVPALVFIDRQGTIRAEYEGDDKFFGDEVQDKNLREAIGKLLAPAPAARKTPPSKTASKN